MKSRLCVYAACLSAVAYFLTSEGIRNYLRLLAKAAGKAAQLVGMH
jgi:hypothetical protein